MGRAALQTVVGHTQMRRGVAMQGWSNCFAVIPYTRFLARSFLMTFSASMWQGSSNLLWDDSLRTNPNTSIFFTRTTHIFTQKSNSFETTTTTWILSAALLLPFWLVFMLNAASDLYIIDEYVTKASLFYSLQQCVLRFQPKIVSFFCYMNASRDGLTTKAR